MSRFAACTLALTVAAAPGPALAYIGPGAGISAIGTALGLLGAVLLAVIALVWYPLKRLIRSRRTAAAEPETPAGDSKG